MSEQFPFSSLPKYQHTLGVPVSCEGTGLHLGVHAKLVMHPAPDDSGLVFTRTDVQGKNPHITLHPEAVCETRRGTRIVNADGISLATVEHVLAALAACGVDNAAIAVDGPEIPAMDGSAVAFTDMIARVGLVQQVAPRKFIDILAPVELHDGKAFVRLEPSDRLRIDARIHYPETVIGDQHYSFEGAARDFIHQIAPARTFALSQEVEALRAAGLALGGSLANCIVVDGMNVQNQQGLRFQNEFVRHKVLDILGDLALAGAPILGQFTSRFAGHKLNNALLRTLVLDTSAWRWKTFS